MSCCQTVTIAPPASGSARHYTPFFLASFCLFVVLSTFTLFGAALDFARVGVQDWIVYWSSARQLVQLHNPYDPAALLTLEQAHGIAAGPYMFLPRNPPSLLWVLAPLGCLSAHTAGLAWRLVLLTCLLGSVWLLQTVGGRQPNHWYRLAWIAAPAMAAIEVGQTTLLSVLGIALFLRLLEERPALAGAALSLCMSKPHLFLPFAVVLLCWTVQRRQWRLAAGFAAALALQSALPLLADPAVWQHYCAAMLANGLAVQRMPTLPVALRFLIDPAAVWLQGLPALAGCLWALLDWHRRRSAWDWRTETPRLLLVSLLVAPYAWPGVDGVLILPAIVQLAPRCSERALGALLLLLTIVMVQFGLGVGMSSPVLLWETPAWLAWYLSARRTVPAAAAALA